MREYAKLSPRFWIGETGKAIKERGIEAQLLATYLISSPHSNMVGVYYLPLYFITHETGMSAKTVTKALQHLIELDFCTYDEEHEYIYVHNMARFQMAESLNPRDHLVTNVNNSFQAFPKLKCLQNFFDKYRTRYHLKKRQDVQCSIEAPSEMLLSQENEQDQEHEQDQELENENEGDAESENDSAYDANETALINILLKNGEKYEIHQSQVNEWQITYPNIDVIQVLRCIKDWNDANPKKRKLKSGIKRHINLWLAREQDKISNAIYPSNNQKSNSLFTLNQTIANEWLQTDSVHSIGDN